MIVFPAIDLSGGKIVRLQKGNFDKKKIYTDNLENLVKNFEKNGAEWIHVIDLDGALSGQTKNAMTIKKIIETSNCKIQLGGGVRTFFKIEEWLNLGVERVIIGTEAIINNKFVEKAVSKFPNKIAVGLDLVGNHVAINGWTKIIKEKKAEYYFNKFSNIGVECIIYTDINKDGVLKGPNINNTIDFMKMVKVPIIASGGIASLNDLIQLKKKNVYGAIVGKAIYEKRISLNSIFDLK